MRRRAAFTALLGAIAALCVLPAAAGAAPRALIAFVPTEPAPKSPLLFDLAERDFSYGMASPSIGAYSKRQMVLDVSQGSRIANSAYPEDLGRLDLRWDPDGGGQVKGFRRARRRADDAPGDVIPGLLGESLRRRGMTAAYVGVVGFPQTEAVAAADRRGRLTRVSLGTIGTFARRALAVWEENELVVARFPADEAGLAELDRVLAERRSDDLVLVVRAPPAGRGRLLPAGMLGPESKGDVLYSPTTRRLGLVAVTDFAPTALEHLGIDPPDEMDGRTIEARADGDAEEVRLRMARLDVLLSRRGVSLRWFVLGFAGLAAAMWFRRRREGLDEALRTGFLGAMWLPGMALVAAYFQPTRLAEIILLAGGSLALGRATDRLVRWPLAPAVPGLTVFAMHAIDLARGSPLIGASLAGPNPKGGARFFGIGNELEILLSLEVLFGLGALLTLTAGRRVPWGFAIGCLVAAVVIGAGRLGADVGGVITLGAGAAGAVLASLPGGPSRRAIAIACTAPVLGLALLVAIDVLTGGGAHLTRTVLEGEGAGGLVEIVKRRLLISAYGLERPIMLILVVVGIALLVWGVRRRDDVLRPIRAQPAFVAGMWGALSGTVVGALSNDSGPVIFIAGFFGLLMAAGYGRGAPGASPRRASRAGSEGASTRHVTAGEVV
ncbi:MAG: hypothetical protein M3340_06740 [Actinomycetota bacterium]|nr:hypothetical protein [Actinomycetota bacterium]